MIDAALFARWISAPLTLSTIVLIAACSDDPKDELDCGSSCTSPCAEFCLNYANCFTGEAEAIGLKKFGSAIDCDFADPSIVIQACVASCEAQTTDDCATCLADAVPACGVSSENCDGDCGSDVVVAGIRRELAENTLCAAADAPNAASCMSAQSERASAWAEDELDFTREFAGLGMLVDDDPVRVLLSNGSTIAFSLPSEVPLPSVGAQLSVDLDLFCGLGCDYLVGVTWTDGFFGVWKAGPTRFDSVGPVTVSFEPAACAAGFSYCAGATLALDLVLANGTKIGAGQRGSADGFEVVFAGASGLLWVELYCTDNYEGNSNGYVYKK